MSIRFTLAAAALAIALTPASLAGPASRPGIDAAEVQRMIATWPADAREKAIKMIKRKGLPDAVTDSALIWEVGDIRTKRPRKDPTLVQGSILPNSELAQGRSSE